MRTSVSNVVSRYLEYVNTAPSNGRGLDWHNEQIEKLTAKLQETNMTWMVRLRTTQRLHDYIDARDALEDNPTDDFIKVCTQFSLDNNIGDAAWRELGVPASVLREADEYHQKMHPDA